MATNLFTLFFLRVKVSLTVPEMCVFAYTALTLLHTHTHTHTHTLTVQTCPAPSGRARIWPELAHDCPVEREAALAPQTDLREADRKKKEVSHFSSTAKLHRHRPISSTPSVYCILLSKHPWALKIHGPKNGGGCFTRRGPLYVHCITYIHAVHKKRGGCLHGDGC